MQESKQERSQLGRGRYHPFVLVLSAAALAGANFLFVRYVGSWLAWSGGACILLAAVTLLLAMVGRWRQSDHAVNLLLALTLLNFNGWGFSHLGNLLFYIGLYYFALFGILMGAAMQHWLSPFRPLSRWTVMSVGVVFVLGSWVGGLVLEASYVHQDAYRHYVDRLKFLQQGETPDNIAPRIKNEIHAYFKQQYGVLTPVTFFQWGLEKGELNMSIPGGTSKVAFALRQHGIGLAIRLVLSLLLLVLAVFSQLWPLIRYKRQPEPITRGNAESATPTQ